MGTSSTLPAETEIFLLFRRIEPGSNLQQALATSGTDFLPVLKEVRKPVPLRE